MMLMSEARGVSSPSRAFCNSTAVLSRLLAEFSTKSAAEGPLRSLGGLDSREAIVLMF